MFVEQYLNKMTFRKLMELEHTSIGKKRLLDVIEDALRSAHYDGLYSGRERYNVSARWYMASIAPKAEFGMTRKNKDGWYSIPILYRSSADGSFHIGSYDTNTRRFKEDDVHCWTYFFEPDLDEFISQEDLLNEGNA